MDWVQNYRSWLPEHLDANGDLAPPWEKFPTYERHTIGWRMGAGEDWLMYWHVFLESLDPSRDTRIAFLRRHPPAPVTWADKVYGVLHPSDESGSRDVDDDVATERRHALMREGLIASDIAYSTWLSQQKGVRWPWETSETPEDAARYWTREFWFWSRQVAGLRRNPEWVPPSVPDSWRSCDTPMRVGKALSPDPVRGLLTLAQMLAAGRVTPPWQLGLTHADFADTFDEDMGYVDAFRCWGMSVFDDGDQLARYLADTDAPEAWVVWSAKQFLLF